MQACHQRRLGLVRVTAEVHLPEGCRRDVLEAERGPGSNKGGPGRVGIEVGHQVTSVEPRLPLVAFVADAALLVLRRGVHHAQRKHLPALPHVAPPGLAAARARRAAVHRVHALAVDASRTKPPLLQLRRLQVDPVYAHPARAGVESVLRGKLAQRGRRRPFVLEHLVVGPGARLAVASVALVDLAQDHRAEHDALLREGVVGDQPLVREEVVRLAVVDLAQNALKPSPLAFDLVDLGLCAFVLRTPLQRPGAPLQRLSLAANRLALPGHLGEAVQKAMNERPVVKPGAGNRFGVGAGFGRVRVGHVVAEHELRQRLLVGIAQVLVERGQERRGKLAGMFVHEVEERIWKPRQPPPLHVGEHLAHRLGHGALVHARGCPAVQAVRDHLPFQHGGRVQEDAGRLDLAGQHVQGLFVVVEVVGPSGGQGQVEGVAVASPRSTRPLHVVGGLRRDRAEHDRGQVADVDPELQRGRCRQDVGAPRPVALRREPLLKVFAFFARQEGRVLGGDDAADLHVAVEAPEPSGASDLATVVRARGRQVQVRHVQPQLRLPTGDDQRAARAAPHLGDLRGDVEAVGRQAPCVLSLADLHLLHKSRGVHRLEDDV